LLPADAPIGWSHFDVPVSRGAATLGYPPQFAPFAGDVGTASAAVRDPTGRIRAYLNVTPRQGDERLRGFAAFRVHRLADEHDRSVHLEAAEQGPALHGGHRSCVLDDYVTRIGRHHYRELACFVVGSGGGAAVVVAAATTADWRQIGDTSSPNFDGPSHRSQSRDPKRSSSQTTNPSWAADRRHRRTTNAR
jgi:hypothetical protein